MYRRFVLLFAAALAAPAGIIVKDQQYRFCQNGGCSSGNPDTAKSGLPVVEQGDGYKLVFIEYKEDGSHFDDAQLQAALRLIRDERMAACELLRSSHAPASRLNTECASPYGGAITLFAYVHGWKNNANIRTPDNPGDVEKFRGYLAAFARTVKPESARPIVGVYFAWRGASLNLPTFINWISFWSRSSTALRVGRAGPLTQDFDELIVAAREAGKRTPGVTSLQYQEALRTTEAASDSMLPDAYVRSRVIVLSHSFGARVLQTALLGTAFTSASGTVSGICKGLVKGQSQRPPVDMILFENAATGAGTVWKTFDTCQPCGNKEKGCPGTPAIGGDFSRTVMVRAPSFDRVWCANSPDDARCQPYPLVVSISGGQDILTRLVLFLASGQHPASFLPWLRSHRVLHADKVNPISHARGDVLVFEAANGQRYLLRRKSGEVNSANAIWTLEVNGQIVKDHGDVWNYSLMNFEISLIASTDQITASEFSAYDAAQKRVNQPLCPACTGTVTALCGKGTPGNLAPCPAQ